MILREDRSGRNLTDDPHDVIVEREDHQADQHEDPDLLGPLPVSFAHRFSLDELDQKEKDVAPIEHRNGQQVE